MSGRLPDMCWWGRSRRCRWEAPKVFDIEDRRIAVYRLEDGFHAIDDICTHDGGPLAEGEVEGDQVICPRHGARFPFEPGRH